MPGPPRKPTALKLLAGNPGKRRLNRREPQSAPVADSAPPIWLRGSVALEAWAEIAPECHRVGLLTQLGDRLVLAGGCRWWAIYRKADQRLETQLTQSTRSNGRQAKPELAIAKKAFEAAMSVFTRFGVTPAERARLEMPPTTKPTPTRHAAKDPARFFGA